MLPVRQRIHFRALVLWALGSFFVCWLVLSTSFAAAQSIASPSEPNLPQVEPARTIRFKTDEGTYLSLHLSPDGRTIIFDLLCRIYTLPIAGGQATRLTTGLSCDSQPQFSPNGKTIAFVSDRDGWSNLWLMDTDGSNVRQLTKKQTGTYISPTWMPEGNGLLASAEIETSRAGYGSHSIVYYPIDGGPARALVPSPGGQVRLLGPSVGANGRVIFFAQGKRGTGNFQVQTCDIRNGSVETRTSEPGGAFRPVVSRDGKYLVYGSRREGDTWLKLMDLQSGESRWLIGPMQHDEQAHFSQPQDVMPGSVFTPDSKQLITSFDGKIWKVDVASGKATMIPFSVEVEQQLGSLSHFEYPFNDSELTVRSIRNVRISPDGKRAVFSALDRIYVMDLPGGRPRRLTKSDQIEQSPAWSPDGKHVAFVTWSNAGGSISRTLADGSSEPERLTIDNAFYDRISYMPDGMELIAVRGAREEKLLYQQDLLYGANLVRAHLKGRTPFPIAPVKIVNHLGWPQCIPKDPSHIYFYLPGEGLVSMGLDGSDRKTVLKLKNASVGGLESEDTIQLSPDGRLAVIAARFNVYLIEMPSDGSVPTIDLLAPGDSPVPIRRISAAGGFWPSWAHDGKAFSYSLGHSIFIYDVSASGPLTKAQSKGPSLAVASRYEPLRIDANIVVPKDRPSGTMLLRGARILTMKGHEVIENGDVLIVGNRIRAIGNRANVPIPRNAKVLDVTGKTILPGWVDIHAHAIPTFGVHSSQVWEYLASLAYGVTTNHDPSGHSNDLFTYMDRLETGDLLGSRLFTTGQTVQFGEDIRSFEDALAIARRHGEFDNTQTFKRHFAASRQQEQWLVRAAREFKLTLTVHQSTGNIKSVLPIVLDGNSGIEHNISTLPLYSDVIQLLAKSGVTYTPTLLVTFEEGQESGESYFFAHSDLNKEARLRRFLPPFMMQIYTDTANTSRARATQRNKYPLLPQYAAQAARLLAAGGRVGLGSHGQLPGLGAHWELWALAMGGMPPYDVLRVGTILGAEAIGHGQDFGSLEIGKLADLQILDRNPLEDIHNTNSLRYVMKNGRLYEAATLNEVWPRQREMASLYWWKCKAAN
jgi:imidazolonepropionase-like amidohydrolase/Tol biopolymer transport system component